MGRVITKEGDVYETVPTEKGTRLLHFVAIDLVDLNSDVIIVYKPHVSLKDIKDKGFLPENVDFYTHTTVSQGVKQGLWHKIGKVSTPPLHLFPFKQFHDEEEKEADQAAGITPASSYPYWTTWTPDDTDWHVLSADEGAKLVAEDGLILPANDVIYRIEHGKSKFSQ